MRQNQTIQRCSCIISMFRTSSSQRELHDRQMKDSSLGEHCVKLCRKIHEKTSAAKPRTSKNGSLSRLNLYIALDSICKENRMQPGVKL